MIKVLTKKGCAYCEAVSKALKEMDIPFELVYNHDEKVVPQGFDKKTGKRLFLGLPQFDYIKELRDKYGIKNKK